MFTKQSSISSLHIILPYWCSLSRTLTQIYPPWRHYACLPNIVTYRERPCIMWRLIFKVKCSCVGYVLIESSQPSTSLNCERLEEGDNQKISYSSSCTVELGCQASYSCDEGYELVGGAIFRTCSLPPSSIPVWEGVAPRCEKKGEHQLPVFELHWHLSSLIEMYYYWRASEVSKAWSGATQLRIRDIFCVWTYICHFVLWPSHFCVHSEVDPFPIPH